VVRSFWRNVGFNLIGTLVPALVALAALPVIAAHAGVERLGILGLVWALVGHLGVLDLGLSRVMTRRVAACRSKSALAEEAALVRRLTRVLVLAATAVTLLLALVVLLTDLDRELAPPALQGEIRAATLLAFALVPVSVLTSLARGVLEGRGEFALVNRYKVAFGLWNFGAPAIVSTFSPSLATMVAAITAGRLLALYLHDRAARRSLPLAAGAAKLPLALAMREGGWLSVSGVVSPLMASTDRFFVAALVSAEAAAHYFVPQEVALRLLLLPAALATVLFASMSHGLAGDAAPAIALARRASWVLLAAALAVCVPGALVAPAAISAWMGQDFAAGSAPAAVVLLIGLLACFVAQVPYSAIQAAGRADLTAKLHLAELPIFFVASLVLTTRYGVAGAAAAWSARLVLDWLALTWIARRLRIATSSPLQIVATAIGLAVLSALAARSLLLV
jgi:O-antigen/teichoic acid export membrane protein